MLIFNINYGNTMIFFYHFWKSSIKNY